MLNAGKLSAVILATGIALHVGGPRASAQTSNVVIQWNQTLQAQFVGTGPGIHIRALPIARATQPENDPTADRGIEPGALAQARSAG